MLKHQRVSKYYENNCRLFHSIIEEGKNIYWLPNDYADKIMDIYWLVVIDPFLYFYITFYNPDELQDSGFFFSAA